MEASKFHGSGTLIFDFISDSRSYQRFFYSPPPFMAASRCSQSDLFGESQLSPLLSGQNRIKNYESILLPRLFIISVHRLLVYRYFLFSYLTLHHKIAAKRD